jgi:hypothetical protein
LQYHKNILKNGTGKEKVTHEIPYLSFKILTFKSKHAPLVLASVSFLNLKG